MATPFLSDDDIRLLAEGNPCRGYEKLGAHLTEQDGVAGTHFAVWAPNAQKLSVIGDFNGWETAAHPMQPRGTSGLWECFLPGVGVGALYRYSITSRSGSEPVEKLDPFGVAAQLHPRPASKVWDLSGHSWGDGDWLANRPRVQALDVPLSIYEVHLGSWRRAAQAGNPALSYREMAPLLAEYAHEMGFTHVEFLPVAEHARDGSGGYQTLSYFAPAGSLGTPQDFMFLIDTLHQKGLGVILDWTAAHFPRHALGLTHFDGTPLYEHEGADGFNYGRPEVANFLIGNALFWLDRYHIDGLRVGAVAAMVHADFPRKEGEWVPRDHGGWENREAVAFLRRCNEQVNADYPGVLTIAEEAPAGLLGWLGFGLKWDVVSIHDALSYLALETTQRKSQHNRLTARALYAFRDHYVLPLSHDEVVPGKKSLLTKMAGDEWQKFANLRLLFGYVFAQPAKKLVFMGGEFGQWNEWHPDTGLDWHLLDYPLHRGLNRWVRDLNTFYRGEPAFHQLDCDPAGFEWVETTDADRCVLSFLRKGKGPQDLLLVVCNFTPTPQYNYRVGISQAGRWEEILNSDAVLYGGSGQGNLGGVVASPISWHGRPYLLNLTLPPLGMVVFRRSSRPAS